MQMADDCTQRYELRIRNIIIVKAFYNRQKYWSFTSVIYIILNENLNL